ncbi:MAG: hypothetical protein U9P14_08890 [Gemmatimonadota bacterium]|nr:hypothetical protein [Gemmatimonadota bacterium]
MVTVIFKIIIFYLIFRLVWFIISKGALYYRAYRQIRQRQRAQQAAMERKRDFNLQAFDVEDAEYEEIKPGKTSVDD